jgi:spoIIIJ-associated protein
MAVRLRPMTAYERRVVHVALRGDKRVTTASDGADPFRQVVIAPK